LTVGDVGCVPANPFGAGTMSQEAIDYILEGDMYRTSDLEQHFAEIVADTEIFDGWYAGPIGVAVGGSYRKDSFEQWSGPDDLVAINVLPAEEAGYRGLPAGFSGADAILQFSGINDAGVSGEFDVWEVFAEALVPLIKDLPMIQQLD